MVLVLIAFLFRQGFGYRDGRIDLIDFSYSRLVFIYDWVGSLFWLTRCLVRFIQVVNR